MNNNEQRVPILSFYSGGGFLDMGFEMAGFDIVWTNEVDPVFVNLHAAGITSWRKASGNVKSAEIFNTSSITDVSSADIVNEAFPNGKPKIFGIIGGPPCQDFSMNGSLKGFEGERGKLTILYFNKILELMPTFFVMENVTGLLKRKSHREFLSKLLKRVEKKYHIDYNVLNALDFGVPQFRERVFFVGIRKSHHRIRINKPELLSHWFPWPENRIYTSSATKYKWPLTNTYGEKLIKPEGLPEELCVESCLVSEAELTELSNSTEYFNLYNTDGKLFNIKEGETTRPSFKRLHRFRYSPTACYGNNEVHLHPYENRRLSVRETLRIQGVPDSYVLPAELPLSKKFKMIGNGVPVPLANAVADSLKGFLKKKRLM